MWRHLKERDATPVELLHHLGLYESPIRVVDVAEELGVVCSFVDTVEWVGAIEASTQTGAANIYVHRELSSARQRFTIAYEIGHLMRHADDGDVEGEWTYAHRDRNLLPHSDEQQQANEYAAKLLMPPGMVRSIMDNVGMNVDLLPEAFEVSRGIMRRRL